MAATRCCSCNGVNAVCKRCICARNGRLCHSCLPSLNHRCVNQRTIVVIQPKDKSCDQPPNPLIPDTFISDFDPEPPPDSLAFTLGKNDDLRLPYNPRPDLSQDGHYLEQSEVDDLITQAYGVTLVKPMEESEHCLWHERWQTVIQHHGNHYSLPGGSVGKTYVDVLTDEVLHMATGNFPSERLIVFSSLVLQRDRSVKKGNDIRRLLERRLSLWKEEKFNILLQEYVRCNNALKYKRKSYDSAEVDKIFSKLMLQGKVSAAVR